MYESGAINLITSAESILGTSFRLDYKRSTHFDRLVINVFVFLQAKHNKKYNDAGEEKLRYKIYLENRHKIAKHNTRFHQKNETYKLSLNKYADMLHSEFVRTLNGFNRTRDDNSLNSVYKTFSKVEEPVAFIGAANVEVPTSVDWRKDGAVTDVKDQGHCGQFS